MTSSPRLGLMIVALLAGSLAFACGGGDGTSDDDAAQPEASEDADGDDAENGGGNDGAGGDLEAELRRLAEEFRVGEVKIEYIFSRPVEGSADVQGTYTLYFQPPDAWRLDTSSSAGDVTMIQSQGTTYLCSSDGGTGQCLESHVATVIPIPFLSVFTEADGLGALIDVALSGVDVDRSLRKIAGQDATCFSISATIVGETGAAEYCFREDGILLLLRAGGADAEGAGEFIMEATNVEDSVSDSDLEPPYDVTEIPGFP